MKEKLLSILFVFVLSFFMFLSLIIPDEEVSVLERRNLEQFPELSISNVLYGDFFEELNVYLSDQFPFRDNIRKLKNLVSQGLFKKNVEGDMLIKNNSLYQLDNVIDYKSLEHFTSLINEVDEKFLVSENIYYSIIPDKNYYLNGIPKLDYEILNEYLDNKFDYEYIDIYNDLNIDSYYRTDIHWRQEALGSVLLKLSQKMNFESVKFTNVNVAKNFYGALYGRIANNVIADEIRYFSDDDVKNAIVYDYESGKYSGVYNVKNLNNVDMYDIFLGGARAVQVIENENADSDKELIIFRDSFASSLAPLLVPSYSKITLIDLRYIKSEILEDVDVIKFNKKQDVLFLYSTSVINNSFILK